MRELNPLIRNAIFTALHAARHMSRLSAAKTYVEFQTRMIPSYWEDPDLLPDFVEVCEMGNRVGNVGELKKPARHRVRRSFRRATERR